MNRNRTDVNEIIRVLMREDGLFSSAANSMVALAAKSGYRLAGFDSAGAMSVEVMSAAYSILDKFDTLHDYSNGFNDKPSIQGLLATLQIDTIGCGGCGVELVLDETLTSREIINTKMRTELDRATDPWGIKVNRVELKNIMPPPSINEAMEKQMKAERESREAILIAEGQKKSSILVAQGKKESAILDAEAEKQAQILRAEAKKEATIREAEGQAEAILAVQQAKADGIRFIKEAGADEAVLRIKSLEAFEKVGDGQATKIIIPSEIQNMAGLVTSITEVAKTK